MSFNDLIVEIPNVISKELCEEIIERFEADDGKYQGVTAGGEDLRTKVSTDLHISSSESWAEIDDKLYQATTSHFSQYTETYSKYTGAYPDGVGLHDTGFQIQRTNPGEFYHWHHDYQQSIIDEQRFCDKNDNELVVTRDRLFTFILYLNDRTEYQEDGRTQFQNCGDVTSIVAEPGKLLLFPANPLYTHRGETLENGVKYLITGWCCSFSHTRMDFVSDKQLETISDYVRSFG